MIRSSLVGFGLDRRASGSFLPIFVFFLESVIFEKKKSAALKLFVLLSLMNIEKKIT